MPPSLQGTSPPVWAVANPDGKVVGPVPQVQHPAKISLCEFNGDGRKDTFIADNGMDANPFSGRQNALTLSVPGGKLADASTNLPQKYDGTHSTTAADLDADGDVDIVAARMVGPGPVFYLNDSRGAFSEWDHRLDLCGFAFLYIDRDGWREILLSGNAHDGWLEWHCHYASHRISRSRYRYLTPRPGITRGSLEGTVTRMMFARCGSADGLLGERRSTR